MKYVNVQKRSIQHTFSTFEGNVVSDYEVRHEGQKSNKAVNKLNEE